MLLGVGIVDGAAAQPVSAPVHLTIGGSRRASRDAKRPRDVTGPAPAAGRPLPGAVPVCYISFTRLPGWDMQ